jgi:predicted RNA-binding protein with PIN domain
MKKYYIDGHNLIPKIPGINLSDMDDENKLIEQVAEFCRLSRSRANLFFDGAPAGSGPRSRFGLVHVHHVRAGTTADDAIIRQLRREESNARDFIVVSSDHRVKTEAKALRAEVMSSEQFAQTMRNVLQNPAVTEAKREVPPSPEEVDEMLKLMTARREKRN